MTNQSKTSTLTYLFLCLIILIGMSCKSGKLDVQDSMHNNTLSPKEKVEGWSLLFDGKNTNQWRGYNQDAFPQSGWSIDTEGNLVQEGSGGGTLITREKYENFHLKMDFLVEPEGNSGIFYRAPEGEGSIWSKAPEYQLLDDQAYLDKGMDMHTHLTGDNYDLQAAPGRYAHAAGEWNTAEIIVNGNHVEHWLNGQKTVEYAIESPEWEALVAKSKFAAYPDYARHPQGHIGLQDHGHMTKFRNLKIKILPTSYQSLYNGKDLSGWEIYGTEKWYVENSLLVCESGPDQEYGYLGTKEKFKDFDLILEFMQEADGNSGVFFRSSIEGTKIAGWQAEVAPPGKHTGGIYESYGRGWLIQPPQGSDASLKMGDWNTMRVKAVGDEVTTWLNGHRMIHLKDEKIGEAIGQIALQIHSGGGIKVKWRNIKLRSL